MIEAERRRKQMKTYPYRKWQPKHRTDWYDEIVARSPPAATLDSSTVQRTYSRKNRPAAAMVKSAATATDSANVSSSGAAGSVSVTTSPIQSSGSFEPPSNPLSGVTPIQSMCFAIILDHKWYTYHHRSCQWKYNRQAAIVPSVRKYQSIDGHTISKPSASICQLPGHQHLL